MVMSIPSEMLNTGKCLQLQSVITQDVVRTIVLSCYYKVCLLTLDKEPMVRGPS